MSTSEGLVPVKDRQGKTTMMTRAEYLARTGRDFDGPMTPVAALKKQDLTSENNRDFADFDDVKDQSRGEPLPIGRHAIRLISTCRFTTTNPAKPRVEYCVIKGTLVESGMLISRMIKTHQNPGTQDRGFAGKYGLEEVKHFIAALLDIRFADVKSDMYAKYFSGEGDYTDFDGAVVGADVREAMSKKGVMYTAVTWFATAEE
jgi:hypothetical protein